MRQDRAAEDFETFRHAQRRHRLSARLRTVPAVLAAAVMGIPLGVYLSPVLLALAIVTTDLLNLVTPMPDIGGAVWGWLDRLLEGDPGTLMSIVLVLMVWVLPGVVVLVLTYLLVRWRLGRVGGEGVTAAVGARLPRADDPQEQQLVNVAAELAVAAGIGPPVVLLYDSEPVDALVFGPSHDRATILVSRRALDTLDREATQGSVARLIASAGDGDIGLAISVGAVYVSYGLVSTALLGVISGPARARFRRAVVALSGGSGDPGADAVAIEALLGLPRDEDAPSSAAAGCLSLLTMGGIISVGSSVINLFLTGPLLTLTWRSRGYLADATAVELTRDPTGLANALRVLGGGAAGVAAGGWLELVQVIGRPGSTSDGGPGVVASLAPPISQRIARLEGMGAVRPAADPMLEPAAPMAAAMAPPPRGRRTGRLPKALAIAIIVPLLALAGILAVVAVALIVWLVAVAAFIVLAIIAGPIHDILRSLAGR